MGALWVLPENPDEVHSLLFLRSCFNHPSVMIRAHVLSSHGLRLSQAASPRKQLEFAAIRRQIRRDLGLPESEEAAAVHGVIASDLWPHSFEWFDQAVSWLNTVFQSNRQARVFPVNAFGTMLADKLFLHCSMASRRGLNGWRLYRRAEFAKARRQSSLTTIKMIAKALVKPRVA
jgi:hypothetical protein